MNNPTEGLAPGARIRVTLEGYFVPAAMPENRDLHFYLRPERHPGKDSSRIAITGTCLKDLELIEAPIKDHGVYKCAEGFYWEYSALNNKWYTIGQQKPYDFDVPKRPLKEVE